MLSDSREQVITVAIAEPRAIVRQGLRRILEEQPDFRVVAEANSGREIESTVEELKPSVLVTCNGVDCLGLTQRLTSKSAPETGTGTNVVVLSESSSSSDVQTALHAGAKAWVLTESNPEELVSAIRQAAKGQYYLSYSLSQDLFRQFAHGKLAMGVGVDGSHALTSRQRQVYELCAKNWSCAEIADSLGISRRTVEVHKEAVRKKLGFRRNVTFTRYFQEKGVIPWAKPV